MRTIDISEAIKVLISETVKEIFRTAVDVPDPESPPEMIDAEYAVGCFPFSRILRDAPNRIAEQVASKIIPPGWLKTVTAYGPYLNFKLDESFIFKTVLGEAIEQGDRFGYAAHGSGQTILVEYSSPNTNKPLHLGHVRNNVLGMAVINLLRAAGHCVIPASIMNDRGIHICKAMVAYRRFGDDRTPESMGIKGDHFVGEMYVTFDRAAKNDSLLLDEARMMLRLWEEGDDPTIELWRTMNKWVIDGFEKTYRRLGSVFELVQHESQTYLLGKDVVQDGLEKGLFFRKDDNSVWVDLSTEGLDEKALLRSDGTSLYITQDLGVAVERFRNLKIDRVVYIVGSEQIYHFNVLFAIFRKLGYAWANQCAHLSYGMVYLPEGKMKSREGNVVDADDLIDEMQSLSLAVMEESHMQIELDNRAAVAESIGLGAIKYYILKFNPQKDIHFDPRNSLSFEGATGAYIQYCHARIRSVLRKTEWTPDKGWNPSDLIQQEELDTVRLMLLLPSVIRQSARDLNPARLANHLWDLAKSFNVFYTKHRILDAGSDALTRARLGLALGVANALKSGLELLGIDAVEAM
ncbi:arginine--tRNA ligase [bacterium]|nr:arginine--tRNA ligase [candidate division CSSED10-310 bacterium]